VVTTTKLFRCVEKLAPGTQFTAYAISVRGYVVVRARDKEFAPHKHWIKQPPILLYPLVAKSRLSCNRVTVAVLPHTPLHGASGPAHDL